MHVKSWAWWYVLVMVILGVGVRRTAEDREISVAQWPVRPVTDIQVLCNTLSQTVKGKGG